MPEETFTRSDKIILCLRIAVDCAGIAEQFVKTTSLSENRKVHIDVTSKTISIKYMTNSHTDVIICVDSDAFVV